MGKLIAYDPVTMRWLNESTPNRDRNEESSNFTVGFDDPTYLTFKVEFGGWGASNLDLKTYTAMQLMDSNLDYAKQYAFNYDTYPLGLLDLNFADNTIKSQNFYAFTELNSYNAYNYLLQRNEDTRALYLKLFILGLYEIQSKWPYLFKEISGLNSLEQFDPNRGSRLKDANITLKCIEGLGQKIRAILECYKKAAWDAHYQRWVLPENYRQFKMIIYVFERRIFHSTTAAKDTTDNSSAQLGSSIVNFLLSGVNTSSMQSLISGQANPSTLHYINGMLPVYAYECDLCEFNLADTGIGDSFTNNWDSSEPLETTLSINVKNVKTYYLTELCEHIYDIAVMDFTDHLSRMDVSTAQQLVPWDLHRTQILNSEMGINARPGWGGGADETVSGTIDIKQSWNDMVSSWKNLFKGKSGAEPIATSTNDPATYLDQVKNNMLADSLEIMDDRWRNWWHDATVADNNMSGNFLKKLWKVITAGTLQIRLSPGYPNAQSSVINNLLDWLHSNHNYDGMYYSYATRSDYFDTRDRKALAEHLTQVPNGEFHSTATHDNKLSESDATRLTNEMKDNETSKGNDPLTDMINANDDALIPIDEFEHIEPSTGIGVDTELTDIEDTVLPDVSIGDDIEDTELPDINIEPDIEDTLLPDINIEPDIEDTELPDVSIGSDVDLRTDPSITNNLNNMESDIEFSEYIYPNNEMDTIDFINHASTNKIADSIDYQNYAVTSEALNTALNPSEGAIIIEKENGSFASLLPVDGGLENAEVDENGMVVIEKNAAEEILNSGSTTSTQEFDKIDEVFFTTEEMISTMLEDSELLKNKDILLEHAEHLGNVEDLLDLAEQFANENEQLKETYAEHVSSLLDALKECTLEVVRSIPEMEMVGYDNEEDADKAFIEIPEEAAKLLLRNLRLYTIERPELSGMSFQSMMAIDSNASDALVNTQAMLTAVKAENKKDN